MKNRKTIIHEGTYQFERLPEALRKDYVRIDERSLADLVKQSAEYARLVKYYDNNNMYTGDDWCAFFEEIYDYDKGKVLFSSIEELEKKAAVSPHLTLFLAFLQLFGIALNNLNELGRKHLDFYYKEILRFKPYPGRADKVPVFFELNKTTKQVLIPANTLFEAGKDETGKGRYYSSQHDLVVNQARIEEIIPLHVPEKQTVFAIASPLFHLKDGTRTISLLGIPSGLKVSDMEYTSEKGWENMTEIKSYQFQIKPEQPAISAYNEQVHSLGLPVDCPVIRFSLENNTKEYISVESKAIQFSISISGSHDFILENDYGKLDHRKSFFPFGMQPAKGDTFRITSIAGLSPDRFTTITSAISWKPDNLSFTSYYEGYKSVLVTDIEKEFPLSDKLIKPAQLIVALPNSTKTVKLKLYYNLGHSLYKDVYAKVVMHNISGKKPVKALPNTPYTPEIVKMTLNYTLNPIFVDPNDRLFRLSSRGYTELAADEILIPQDDTKKNLFIAVCGIDQPVVLSLYLRLKAYSGNPDKTITPKDYPTWSYLAGNQWKDFEKKDIIQDTTNHFTSDGVLHLNLSPDAFMPHTVFPTGKVWLKLSFPTEDADAFPELETVHTQVLDAVFVNRDNELSHLEKGLPANSITKTVSPIQGVKAVTQPYVSSGGCAEEKTDTFYMRVSERLRHKARAWSIWDYERLILEHFPLIYKVKCIPHATEEESHASGNVLIILFPDCSRISQKNPLQPRLSKALINEIETFVKARCSEFVKVTVRSAGFEEVVVKCEVVLAVGYEDKSFYQAKLNDDLKAFLSPWINQSGDITSCKVTHTSHIKYYVEKRPYVDYIKNLEVFIGNSLDSRKLISDDETLCASGLGNVLTSAENHEITME